MSDQVTQVVRKYPELASDSVGRSLQTELDMFLTLRAINNECLNLGIGLHVLKLYAVWFLQRLPCFHMSRHSVL